LRFSLMEWRWSHERQNHRERNIMARILIICVGSRGDAEPFCALAAQLAAQSSVDKVELFVQKDLKYLVPSHDKIQCHELPFTQMSFYDYAGKERTPPQAGSGHPNPRVRFLGIVTDIMGELVLPCLAQIMSVAAGNSNDKSDSNNSRPVNAIVASSLARQVALEAARQLTQSYEARVSVYLVQLQSLVPTKDYPHYSCLDKCLQATTTMSNGGNDKNSLQEYFDSYIELERHQFEFLKVHALEKLANDNNNNNNNNNKDHSNNSWGFQADMIPVLTGDSPRNIWMVNAVSRHIVPAPTDAGPKVLNVGGLAAAYIPSNFVPPSELTEFFQRHPRPICFGYGSMPFAQAAMVVNTLYRLDRAAVLVGSAMNAVLETNDDDQSDDPEKTAWIKDKLRVVASVPYPWLLPQCNMMFCHGGAGTVHAALRAGIPAVISPLLGDQFFFAQYLEARGWGVSAWACQRRTIWAV